MRSCQQQVLSQIHMPRTQPQQQRGVHTLLEPVAEQLHGQQQQRRQLVAVLQVQQRRQL
jgi:hypothetical protein